MGSLLSKFDAKTTKDASFQDALTNQISISRSESLEAVSLIHQIKRSTSSTTTNLKGLVSDHQLHRRQTVKLEESIFELNDILVERSQRESPAQQFFHLLMSKPDYIKRWQDTLAGIERDSLKT